MTAPDHEDQRRVPPFATRLAAAAAVVLVAVVILTIVTVRQADDPPDISRAGRAVASAQVKRRLVPDEGTLLGSWIVPDDKEAPDAVRQDLWRDREELIERPYDIGHEFHPFDEPFPDAMDEFHVAAGRIPMISWNGTSAAEILAGDHDPLIRERARGVQGLGVPVLLRFWWEMDIEEKQVWASDPDDFVAAWRRVHQLFDDEGVTNASWVWCPTSLAFATNDAELGPDRWWPGDGWVDWVCADGYNFAPAKAGDVWRPFAEIFDDFYEWARRKDKPIMIGEFGVLERQRGEKADWLRQAADDLERRFPEIRAAVYFDSRRIVDGAPRNWRIDTSPGASQAFVDLAASLGERLRR